MKNLFHTTGLSRLAVVCLAFTGLVFTACSKNDDFNPTPVSAGRLMLYNLAPDRPAVGFTLSGNPLGNTSYGYTNYSGVYLPVFAAANRELRSFDYNTNTTVATSVSNYADSTFYSAFLIGANGTYRHVITEDDFSNVVPVAGKSWVRYINAVPDSSTSVNVSIGESTEAASYGSVSAFKTVDAGTLNVAINSGAFNASRSLTLTENRVYTILFVGQPGSADPLLAPQVKFVEIGNASN